jgi:mxaK protein
MGMISRDFPSDARASASRRHVGWSPRRWRTRLVIAALAAIAAGAALDAYRLWQAQQWNDVILGRRPVPEVGELPVQVRFMQAHALAQSGAHEDALNRYRALQGDGELGQAARFNSANILLRQAIEVRATQQPGQAIPLIELAKESYREILRSQPAHWDARYNLERAQRLLPDPDEGEGPPAETPSNAERAATTMRGYSAGLP